MNYRALKNGKHPVTKQPFKKGDVIDVFRQIGDKYTTGKSPLLTPTLRVDKETALVMELEATKEHGEEVMDALKSDIVKAKKDLTEG